MPYATDTDLAALVQGDIDTATAQLLLDVAAGAVDGEVGASLEETTYVETFDEDSPEFSPDRKRLWIVPAAWPATVSQVDEDGTTLTTDDYELRVDGALVRLDAEGNPDEWGDEVEVTYTTGFTADDLAYREARRISLQVAARSAANPQHLDAITADGVSPSFVVREGVTAVPPLTLFETEKSDLKPWRWRRRLA